MTDRIEDIIYYLTRERDKHSKKNFEMVRVLTSYISTLEETKGVLNGSQEKRDDKNNRL